MENPSPTILQVIPALVAGGAERGAIDVALAIQQIGWRPVVVSADGPMVYELRKAGIKHITLPLDKKGFLLHLRNCRMLRSIIESEKVDIVHARSRAPAWAAWQAVKQVNKKRGAGKEIHFMTTFHGTYNIDDFGRFKNLKKRYNAIMTKGERVIAISDFIANHIKTIYHTDPRKIATISRGIDLNRFNPESVSEERIVKLWQEWRIPEHHPVIMLPGRFTRWKGHKILLEALSRIQDQSWFCVMIGSQKDAEPYIKELEQQIEKLDLQGRVRLLPDCRDMAAAYRIANIVVCPSTDPEAFGRVPVEGQAMGCMTIASGHGGAVETIIPFPDDEATGWLYPPQNADALAQIITKALGMEPLLRYNLATRARAHVAANFTREQMCAETLNVYADLLNPVQHDE